MHINVPLPVEDERGIIEDILVTNTYSITRITFKKGAIRGNHYHNHTLQTDIVVSGKLLAVHLIGKNKIKNETALVEGDTLTHEPTEAHAYKALKDSEMISICIGKRKGKDYEKDTFKLDGRKHLIKPNEDRQS